MNIETIFDCGDEDVRFWVDKMTDETGVKLCFSVDSLDEYAEVTLDAGEALELGSDLITNAFAEAPATIILRPGQMLVLHEDMLELDVMEVS